METENQKISKRKHGGRKPKLNPAIFRYSIRFNIIDNERFLSLFESSGMKTKAHFIIARIFKEEFKVIKIDRDLVDYHTKLTTLFNQFRRIGINYNQVVKELHTNFSEKKALAFLYKLEKVTLELIQTNKQIITLSHNFSEELQQKKKEDDSKN
ncbi:MAG: hypothetical protein IMY73_01960 [Bacteroidetes bacterium]|nr:hypothetical protein [Bacteroidota bacterium]